MNNAPEGLEFLAFDRAHAEVLEFGHFKRDNLFIDR